jgi:hypothetical protein
LGINFESFDEYFNQAIKSIKRLYKSSIEEIKNLYVDDLDYEGLFYWYEDAQEYIKQINNSMGSLS